MIVMEHVIRDAHTHFFSHLFYETLARQGAPGRDPGAEAQEVAVAAGFELPPREPLDQLERWLIAFDQAGVESVLSFASVPEEAELLGEVGQLSGGRLAPLTVVDPTRSGADAWVEKALGEWGHRGIVLFPALHGYNPSDPVLWPVLEKARARRAICVVHCGVLKVRLRELFGLPRGHDARGADPLAVVRPASEFPEITFVIPHFGGGLFREALLAASWCDNIVLDSSSSNEWMKAQIPRLTLTQVFDHALDVLGPRRILYGSDSSTFPRGYRRDLLQAQQAALSELGLDREDKEAILGGNLDRILAAQR